MIATIAFAHGLTLHTANPDAFRGIDGLEVRAVTTHAVATSVLTSWWG